MIQNKIELIGLIISSTLVWGLTKYIMSKNNEDSQINKAFLYTLIFLFISSSGLIAQILFKDIFNIKPIYFEYVVYLGTCFLPVTIYFLGVIFSKTKITFRRKHLLLFVIPIISLIILWTNDFHHLFFIEYSVNCKESIIGPYMIVHTIYSYILIMIGIINLIKSSLRNIGFFSKQLMIILIGIVIPVGINLLASFGIIDSTVYITPITFSIAILCFVVAIYKFQFLSVAPIALRKIVDRISDSYVILNINNCITDFNKTFIDTFNLESSKIRGKKYIDIIKENNDVNITDMIEAIEKVKESTKTIYIDKQFMNLNKYFKMEINSIKNGDVYIGTLILFKDVTQHIFDMEQLQDSQERLMERERLALLGQLIGGIAHNMKTPIMSISGATEGILELAKEYDISIDDEDVTKEDHHQIAKEMKEWVDKIKIHLEYMSDIITAVKGQAVTMANNNIIDFTLDEVVKQVSILMRHELKNALIEFRVSMKVNEKTVLCGNINSLVQVINNMISNAIQAYNGKQNEIIEMIMERQGNNIVISIKDYGMGMKESVKDKLFKEMITTKGKNGTGLGLYMSYSNIKAHFNGNITFESEEGCGTVFHIWIPIESLVKNLDI